MTKEVYFGITNASIFSPLIPLICLFIFLKKQPRQNLIMAVALFLSFAFDMIGQALIFSGNASALCISNNLYLIVAFPAIMWFYHETLVKKSLKILVRIFTVGFLFLALLFALNQGLNVPNYNTMTLSSILITLTSLVFVADLNLMDPNNFASNPYHKTNILLNTSLAVYYFATIVIFAVSDYVFSHASREDARYLWAAHNMTQVLKNIGIAVAFYLSAKRSFALTALKEPRHTQQGV